VSHAKGPAPEAKIRARQPWAAVGTRGEPGKWRRAVEGARVALAKPDWGDARWSYIFKRDDTSYAAEPSAVDEDSVAAAARAARGGEELTTPVIGPIMNAPVWTWEVPAYFWLGGIASGSSWIALASGDRRARRVTLLAVVPCAPLLIKDLGRPERFLNMMRVFKPRSPMNMGAWCLLAFSNASAAAVTFDLLGRKRLARAADAGTALLGLYLGSYTGVLLSSTAVPLWARSKLYLPPIFVSTALATGAATNRLVWAATGTRPGDPRRSALGTIETVAMASELILSTVNEKRLGRLGEVLDEGRHGRMFRAAKWGVRSGLALRFARRRGGPWVHHFASVLYILSGLLFRFAWVEAGKASARDDEAVARMARTRERPLGVEQA
jgi:hypothetical protein